MNNKAYRQESRKEIKQQNESSFRFSTSDQHQTILCSLLPLALIESENATPPNYAFEEVWYQDQMLHLTRDVHRHMSPMLKTTGSEKQERRIQITPTKMLWLLRMHRQGTVPWRRCISVSHYLRKTEIFKRKNDKKRNTSPSVFVRSESLMQMEQLPRNWNANWSAMILPTCKTPRSIYIATSLPRHTTLQKLKDAPPIFLPTRKEPRCKSDTQPGCGFQELPRSKSLIYPGFLLISTTKKDEPETMWTLPMQRKLRHDYGPAALLLN